MTSFRFRLRGPAGEPVDLRRTLLSHGVASLPPMEVADDGSWCEVTLTARRATRTLRVAETRRGAGMIEVAGKPPSEQTMQALFERVIHVLNLDQDLSGFYAMVRDDPDLAWAAAGAGRMVRSATVFEEVVKTICTTNCAWSATVRMVERLVQHLGAAAPGAPAGTWRGRAFPTPAAMAEADESFYRDVMRAGYRGAYLRRFATMVRDGEVDVESWGRATPEVLPDADLVEELLALPGVGPYAAAHIMMMLGRHRALILDSWTRPTYARLVGRKKVADAAIVRRFSRYGPYAGLAFWLFLTRGWVP